MVEDSHKTDSVSTAADPSMAESSLDAFTRELSAKTSVPGGGGAAALAGALAAALGAMTGNFTIGKKKYRDNEPRLIQMGQREEELRRGLLAQIDADAQAFEPLSRAYAIPKDDPTRDETLEKCLYEAAQPPFMILKLSAEAAELAAEYADIGSRLMLSDAGCAAAMAEAAMQAGYLNVLANTRLMKNRERAGHMNMEAGKILNSGLRAAQQTVHIVTETLILL